MIVLSKLVLVAPDSTLASIITGQTEAARIIASRSGNCPCCDAPEWREFPEPWEGEP